MQQDKPKVVLDTNVVISAAISTDGSPAKVFELLLRDRIKNYASKNIIDEVKDVFNRPFFKENLSDEFRSFLIRNFVEKSIMVVLSSSEKIVEKDPKDDKFVHCAIRSKASFIISGDSHLQDLKEHRNIKVLSPKEFLDII